MTIAKRNRWLNWKPETMEKSPEHEPSKPTKPTLEPGSVGFVGAPQGEILIIGPSLPNPAAAPRLPFYIAEDNFVAGPVQLSTHEVVTDSFKFAMSTFKQLRVKMADPKRSVGWTIEELIDRLSAVGLAVVVGEEGVN